MLAKSDRADREEIEAFHAGVNGRRTGRNRPSQVLFVAALPVTFAGAFLAVGGGVLGLVGLCLLAVGLPLLVLIAVRLFRSWDS